MQNLEDKKNEMTDVEVSKEYLKPKKILELIDSGEKWQKQGFYSGSDTRWKQWEKNNEYKRCIWKDFQNEDDVVYNSIFSNINTQRPTLYFKNPKITATAKHPFFKRDNVGNVLRDQNGRPILVDNYIAARIFSSKINYELKEMKFKKLLRKVLVDTLCPYGVGWIKAGFSNLTVSQKTERKSDFNYWLNRVDPRNIVYDPFGTDIDNIRWIAERILISRSDAPKYGIEIPTGYVSVIPDFMKSKEDAANHEKGLITIWEFTDNEENVVYWTLDKDLKVIDSEKDYGDFAKETSVNPYPFEGTAYIPLVFNEDNEDLIGMSDVEPIEDQALAINRLITKNTEHVESFGTLGVIEEGACLPSQLDNIKSNTHGKWLFVKQGRKDSVSIHPTPPIGQDNYAMINEHKMDMQLTLGITDYQRGDSVKRTATEASYLQAGVGNRIDERRDYIKDFVIDVVRKLGAMIQEFSHEEDYVKISDEDFNEDYIKTIKEEFGFNPKVPFIQIPREQIQGEYDYDFNIEDMIQVPKEVQFQQWTQFMGMLGPEAIGMAIRKEGIDVSKILRKVTSLGGIDLDEVKRGSGAQLPALKENMMIDKGMEIQEPHQRDEDAEHNIIHSYYAKELKEKMMQLSKQMQEIMMLEQKNMQLGVMTDPQIMDTKKQIGEELQKLQAKLKKLELHAQKHSQRIAEKEMPAMQSGPVMPQQRQTQKKQTRKPVPMR